MGAGAGLGVALEAEGRMRAVADALQRAVEQRPVRGLDIRRQGLLVHREAVVLAADQHLAGRGHLHRMVRTVVAELHLHRARPAGKAQQLVAETDAEQRHVHRHQLTNRLNGVITGLGVPGAVAQEHTVGLQREHFGDRGLRRHDGDAAAVIDEQPQDVLFDAVIIGDHVAREVGIFPVARRRQSVPNGPAALGPAERLGGARLPCQVHALQARKALGRRQGRLLVELDPGHQAAILGALFAQDAGQAARVDVADGHDALTDQIVAQVLAAPPVTGQRRQVPHDQAGGLDAGRFFVLDIGSGIADVRIGQGDQLPQIGGVRQDLLIAGHRGIEHHLADALPVGADGTAPKDRPVFQDQNRGITQSSLRSRR